MSDISQLDFDNITEDQAREVISSLDIMFKSAGWKFFEHFMNEKLEAHKREIINFFPTKIDDVLIQATHQGKLQGLMISKNILQDVHADLKRQVMTDEEFENLQQQLDL